MKQWKKLLGKALSVGLCAAAVFSQTARPVLAASVDLNAVYTISSNEITGWPTGPEITSTTGVLMEAETGAVLYDKGADAPRYPASITKLMTLLLAVENSSLDETVTFTETGVRDVTWESSNIGMQLGEQITMEDCLYAIHISSANEVAAQVAEYIGGTEQNFVDMMNARAAEIGCTNTHFTNASGLPDPNMYTTARDMALIFREGLKNETFCEIIGNPSHVIPATNMNSEKRPLHTHHPLFAEEHELYYKGCIGGKTGHTDDAGSTLVTGVEQNGVTYIAVVMRAEDLGPACADSTLLFDYGFQNFQKTQYRNGSVVLPDGTGTEEITVTEETIDGQQKEAFYLSGHLVGNGSIAEPTPEPAEEEVTPPADVIEEVGDADEEPLYQAEADTQQESGQEEQGISSLARLLFGIMAAMLVVLVILIAALRVKKKKHKKHRRR